MFIAAVFSVGLAIRCVTPYIDLPKPELYIALAFIVDVVIGMVYGSYLFYYLFVKTLHLSGNVNKFLFILMGWIFWSAGIVIFLICFVWFIGNLFKIRRLKKQIKELGIDSTNWE